ncbi:MAG: LmeA family phospholipid-binding protein [Jatrophihabitans sp.]
MVLVLVIVVVVVLLVAGVVLGLPVLDRGAAAVAERTAAEYLSIPFGHPARVRVHGTPFLTQALRGCYRAVDVSSGGLRIGDMTGATLDASLRNVYLPIRDLIRRRASELPCEHVEGQIVLPYGELARVAKIPGLELSLDAHGRLVASAALPVPGLSQLARVSGHAVLTLAGGNAVWLRIRGVAVAGITVPGLVLSQLLPALNVPIPIPPLPYGLQLDELRPTRDGLVVLGSADAVVFRRLGVAAPADPTT